MKKKIVGFVFGAALLMVMYNNVFAETTVSGIIGSDRTWKLIDSPYIVIGNVAVLEGITLTIEPGVVVKFQNGTALKIDGKLIARGTQENMITLTSNQETPSPGNWEYILFSDSATDATYDYNENYTDGSILEYCIIEYAGGSAVKLETAYPFIHYCTIQNNSGSGILFQTDPFSETYYGTIKVSNCNINNNSEYGIEVEGRNIYAPMFISKNVITSGINASYYGTVDISNNEINGDISLKTFYSNPVTLINNNISSGGIYYDSEDADLKNVIFTIKGNTISDNRDNDNNVGAGLYIKVNTLPYGFDGKVTISDNIIRNNISSYGYGGGGLYCYVRGAPVANCIISNNAIINNKAIGLLNSASGGGIKCENSATIDGNIIMDNTATNGGGGIHSMYRGIITKNIIINNRTTGNGGGMYFFDATPYITNNIISDNTASIGGGIWCRPMTDTLSNNVLIRNIAENGSAFYGNLALNNSQYNTITDNKAIGNNKATVYTYYGNQLNYSNIFNNLSTYDLFLDDSHDIKAEFNYWGTKEVSMIEEKIYHWVDEPTMGIVDYDPFADEVRTDTPISPPTGLIARIESNKIILTWAHNPEADTAGYKVYWSTTSGFPYENIVDVGNITSYSIIGVNPGTLTYYLTVTAYDNNYNLVNDDPDTIVNENQTSGNESWFAVAITIKDSDRDGLIDSIEESNCTNPNDADSDEDGIPDGIEDSNHNGTIDAGETDPCSIDTDGDGIQDGTELGYTLANIDSDTNTNVFQPDLDPLTMTDPLNDDTDGDGMKDGEEDANHNGRIDQAETDPNPRKAMPWIPLLLLDD